MKLAQNVDIEMCSSLFPNYYDQIYSQVLKLQVMQFVTFLLFPYFLMG